MNKIRCRERTETSIWAPTRRRSTSGESGISATNKRATPPSREPIEATPRRRERMRRRRRRRRRRRSIRSRTTLVINEETPKTTSSRSYEGNHFCHLYMYAWKWFFKASSGDSWLETRGMKRGRGHDCGCHGFTCVNMITFPQIYNLRTVPFTFCHVEEWKFLATSDMSHKTLNSLRQSLCDRLINVTALIVRVVLILPNDLSSIS